MTPVLRLTGGLCASVPRRSPAKRRLVGILAAVIVAGACGSGTESADRRGDAPAGSADEPPAAAQPGDCERGRPPAEPEGPSAEAVPLQEAEAEHPAVEAVVYPRPDYEGDPWSQWGQGLALPDGRFLSAIGDHLGPDGNSYLFVYDPSTGRMTRFGDVLSHTDHSDGEWGYGKIHGQIVPGACGEAFFATYWGSDRRIEYGGSYRGDLLFRLDTATLEMELLDVPLPEHGIPSLAGSEPDGLVYGEAPVPSPDTATGSKDGAFFAYDVAAGEVVFRADDERLNGFRNVLVDAGGTAYLSADGSQLLAYEPGANELRPHPERLPGGLLRASTRPASDGTVYGVTEDPDRLFLFRPDGQIEDLGPAQGYTTSVALHPDGERFFYVPGAHGKDRDPAVPLIAVDTTTGEQTTVVELNNLVEEKLGLTLGGSYNVAVDPSGERVYVGFNAGRDPDDRWGEVVLVVVRLP